MGLITEKEKEVLLDALKYYSEDVREAKQKLIDAGGSKLIATRLESNAMLAEELSLKVEEVLRTWD